MIRIITFAERNLFPDPPLVVTVTTTPVVVLADETRTKFEIASRYIQNIGSNDLYFAINQDGVSATICHGLLLAGGNQQLDCSQHRCKVVVVAKTGETSVATWINRRYDDPQ